MVHGCEEDYEKSELVKQKTWAVNVHIFVKKGLHQILSR